MNGDYQAFEVLVQRYRRGIYNFVLRSARDKEAAADLYQEVFLRVVRRSKQYKGESKFSTWLYAIARNICIDHSRRMSHRRHASLDAPRGQDSSAGTLLETFRDPSAAVDRRAIDHEIRLKVAEAVESMPEEQKEIFLMRQIQGLSFQEISDIVEIPINTAKSRMRYALERLREALGAYEEYARKAGVGS